MKNLLVIVLIMTSYSAFAKGGKTDNEVCPTLDKIYHISDHYTYTYLEAISLDYKKALYLLGKMQGERIEPELRGKKFLRNYLNEFKSEWNKENKLYKQIDSIKDAEFIFSMLYKLLENTNAASLYDIVPESDCEFT